MVPLITNLNTPTPRSARPLALSSHLRMPHVYVIPPEEEQQDNPPWCCFDADEQPESGSDFPSNPDIHFLDVPYLLQPPERDVPASLSHRTSVHQPRPRLTLSKKLEKKQRPEAIKIIESRSSQAKQKDVDLHEDSDVIEVVKVKRTREALTDLEENTQFKRTKTLKARATRALRSIKNVGKGSHRTHVKELWTSSESTPGIFKGVQKQLRLQQDETERRPPATPPKKVSLSRASSRSLSQIFQPLKHSRSEWASATLPEAHDVPLAANQSSLPRLKYNNTTLSLTEVENTAMSDGTLRKPTSLSLSTKKTATTKFSVRELHRLFSFSSSSPDDPSSAPIATTAPFSSTFGHSAPSTSTCMLSSDYPDVPMEEGIFADAYFLDLGSTERKLASRYHRALHADQEDSPSNQRRLSDLSFEMRLDSLHFDALSFDPEDFDVAMEGNILR